MTTMITVRGISYEKRPVRYQQLVNGRWVAISRKRITELENSRVMIHWNPAK